MLLIYNFTSKQIDAVNLRVNKKMLLIYKFTSKQLDAVNLQV